jgi:hypothetical protein
MFKKIILISLLLTLNLFSNPLEKAYINISSNDSNTTIFLNGKNIGTAPINSYEIEASSNCIVKAVVDKNYYKNDLVKYINVKPNILPTFNFNFIKADATLFFVGKDADLYINGKFIKRLNSQNRKIKIKANKNNKIKLIDKDTRVTLYKDIKADNYYTIKYDLINIPKDIRLYTTIINNLMWEDTTHAATAKISWEDGKEYCNKLKIGYLDDWKMPTIEQLNQLTGDKSQKIYNGFGKGFYWSSSLYQDDSKLWFYAKSKEFNPNKLKHPIKDYGTGLVRCVKVLKKVEPKVDTKKEKQKEDLADDEDDDIIEEDN